jgi:hypothetical protein
VARAPEQCGRGEATDPAADDDDPAHRYSPSVSATTSWTPATVPATYGNAIE